jgi:dolichol-phosphate mannosyltransferase
MDGPIAVFGGSGFIGANLMRRILSARKDCFAITHQTFIPWRLVGLPSGNVLRCDISSRAETEKLFQRYPFRTIFCFAAYGAYSRQTDAHRIFQTNIQGLLNTLDVAEQRGFSALVHAGSSSEYGTNCTAPLETDPLHPNSYYAVSKASAAYLIEYAGRHRKLPVINLRLYSAYGPWEEWDRLIPQVVEKGLKRELPSLVSADISRDFIYSDDVVDASILAATRGVQRAPGASLNIGTGKKTTIGELVETARDLFGIEETPQWGTMSNRAWDLAEWYANPKLAQEVLEWKPEVGLREGLQRVALWTSEHGSAPKILALGEPHKLVRLSAVVACYKDAQAIPYMYQRLTETFRKLNVDYEILFVNDGSPDDTDQVLEKLCAADQHVVAVEHSRNFGSQNAFLDGMSLSTGDAVILLDGDLQDPPELIEQFYEQWRAGYDVVYGRRVKREATLVLQICYKLFYRVFQGMAYVPIPVDAGDFSLMDRRVIRQLLTFRETDQFLRGLRAWVGFRQTGVDYVRPDRMFGVTTNNWRKNFWWARKAIFSFSFAPMEMLMYGGFVLTGLSFVALGAQFVAHLINPALPHGIATIIILILFFGGLNMLGLSVLGEYIGKVFEEAKGRPKFIRRSIRQGKEHLTSASKMDAFTLARSETVTD